MSNNCIRNEALYALDQAVSYFSDFCPLETLAKAYTGSKLCQNFVRNNYENVHRSKRGKS